MNHGFPPQRAEGVDRSLYKPTLARRPRARIPGDRGHPGSPQPQEQRGSGGQP